ncbi:MAG: hypothetical protein R3B90_18820 [Planctomycetaceae bacterium]
MPASKLKASERQALLQKVVGTLKKKYGKPPATDNRNVLETLLYAVCLENASVADADIAFANLYTAFHDLNEIRVSAISEIERALGKIRDAEWRAMRIRDALQTVFETNFQFDLEHLKRKTNEQAIKELNALRFATPFMKLSVLQSLGGHVVPLDTASHSVLAYLGLVIAGHSLEECSEELKSSIRKSDTALLCHLLRECGADPANAGAFELDDDEMMEIDPSESVKRLEVVLAGGGRKKRPAKKTAASAPTSSAVKKTKKKPEAKEKPKRTKPASSTTKTVKKKVTKKPSRKPR